MKKPRYRITVVLYSDILLRKYPPNGFKLRYYPLDLDRAYLFANVKWFNENYNTEIK